MAAGEPPSGPLAAATTLALTRSVPWTRVLVPLYELAALVSSRVPTLLLVSPPEPLITPA